MNNVSLIGRLTADPEIRQAKETKVCNFTIAVDRGDKDRTADFIRCVAFGKTAEFIDDYFDKGTRIGISGRIQTGSYEDKEDKITRYTTDIIVERVDFADGIRDVEEEKPKNDKRSRRR